ncbi:MAG: hypothetical protein Q4D57_01615 [Clostridia bacterium]|nr:hypothetical protein [Clostridia bacterium]
MGDTKGKISNSDAEKVSGGAIWDIELECAKCKKSLGMACFGNFVRVDDTIYEPERYFCKECAESLTDAEKNKKS